MWGVRTRTKSRDSAVISREFPVASILTLTRTPPAGYEATARHHAAAVRVNCWWPAHRVADITMAASELVRRALETDEEFAARMVALNTDLATRVRVLPARCARSLMYSLA